MPSQEILKIRDGTPLEMPSQEIQKIGDGPFGGGRNFDIPKKALETARPSQEILKIRDGTPLEAEGILTYRKALETARVVARILVFKIRPSQEILKIRDGTPLEAEGIFTYRKRPRNCSGWHFSSKLDVPSNVLQKKRVARILVFKIRPSQEILKIRDGTPLEAEGIFTYRKRPSQEILKIRDGTPLEADGILTYRKSPRNCSVWHFSSKLDVPSNVLQKKRVARILVFKIRPSQEILKIRDGTPLEAEGILTYRKRLSKLLEIQKIGDGPFGGGRNFDIPKKALETARPSQEILKIRDGTPLEAEGILTYRKALETARVGTFLAS
ncbi:hypothetical protein OROMI_025679 [Orobanche minor]